MPHKERGSPSHHVSCAARQGDEKRALEARAAALQWGSPSQLNLSRVCNQGSSQGLVDTSVTGVVQIRSGAHGLQRLTSCTSWRTSARVSAVP